jgi:hypothetical protein
MQVVIHHGKTAHGQCEDWAKPETAAEWRSKLGLVDLPDDAFAR